MLLAKALISQGQIAINKMIIKFEDQAEMITQDSRSESVTFSGQGSKVDLTPYPQKLTGYSLSLQITTNWMPLK